MSTTTLVEEEVAAPPSPAKEAGAAAQMERIDLDASTRWPVLVFFSSAIFWLLFGTLFALIASIKMHRPEFLGEWSWLTFGRVRPVHTVAMVYGWASMAGMGVAIWLMARLCRVPLREPMLPIIGALLWNAGLLAGLGGILAGHSTSVEWLELPGYASALLFTGYIFVGVWAWIMFSSRRPGPVYVTQWYLLGAFFWFPWLFAVANLMIFVAPVQGVVQAAANWWYARNLIGLWFTAIGIGAVYYMIPKVTGRPIHSYYLAALGFWSFAFLFSWNGTYHLIGGPIPAWMVTVGVVTGALMIIPVATVALNHHMTMRGHFHLLHYSPTLRFTVFGAICYTGVSLMGILMAFRSINSVTHFTHATPGHAHLGMYGFFTMVMFGCMYYIVPRLVGCEWRSPMLIKIHFWAAAYGVLLMASMLFFAGWVQGSGMNDATIKFPIILEGTLPYLRARSIAGMLLALAHIVFAGHFLLMLLRFGRPGGGPTLFEPLHDENIKEVGE